jgi:septum formation protein
VEDATLILGSRSARRVRLLEAAGYRFKQVVSPFAEPPMPSSGDPVAHAIDLARAKAAALVGQHGFDDRVVVLLAADTIVVGRDGRLMGKPADRDEAEAMLAGLAGGDHQVVTGVALCGGSGDRPESFADTARVRIGGLGTAELKAHLEGGRWRGKAGGYDLRDVEQQWSMSVAGDPTTVIGLPMSRLEPVLNRWSVHSNRDGVQPCPVTGA